MYIVSLHFFLCLVPSGKTLWRSWLRHCATRQKVAGSIPEGVNLNNIYSKLTRKLIQRIIF